MRFTCLAPLIAASLFPAHPAPARQPNVVVVLIDDMGWADLSCFGNQEVRTENIDRIAAEGIRFTSFYVNAPICSPSRTALTTGQYPQRWRITSFLSNRNDNNQRGMAQWLDPAAPTLARLLHEAGYATGHFGKWHLGGQRDVGEAPLISRYGFDASLTNFEGLGPRVLPLCNAYDGKPVVKHALGSDTLGHGPITWEDRSLVTAAYVGRALEFIREAERREQPFYVNLWPDDVHSPFYPPEVRRGDGKKRTLYLGVLDTMDEQLGVLFDYIRTSEKLRDNTLILLASDNGPEPGAGSAGPLRGGKGMLYEGGVRSPLIAWGPGLIARERCGSANAATMLAAMDLAPSLLSITGVARPAGVEFDGRDFSTTLLGKDNAERDTPIFWRRPPDRPGRPKEPWPDLALREGRWKFLMQFDGSRPELYDVVDDPGETVNLAAGRTELASRFRRLLEEWDASLPPDAGRALETAAKPGGEPRPAAARPK